MFFFSPGNDTGKSGKLLFFLNYIFFFPSGPFFLLQINAEFMRITTLPLQAKFLAELDKHTPNLMKVFSSRGGAAGKKIKLLMAPTAKASALKCLLDMVFIPLSHLS